MTSIQNVGHLFNLTHEVALNFRNAFNRTNILYIPVGSQQWELQEFWNISTNIPCLNLFGIHDKWGRRSSQRIEMGFFTLTLHLINTIIFSTDKNEADQRNFLFEMEYVFTDILWKMQNYNFSGKHHSRLSHPVHSTVRKYLHY